MWINFKAIVPFAVKIYAGPVDAEQVNAISGLPRSCRDMVHQRGDLIQDYAVAGDTWSTDHQRWIDNIASLGGHARQFVATPGELGFTVQHEITDDERFAGISFEIVPFKPMTPYTEGRLTVKTLAAKLIKLQVDSSFTISRVKDLIKERESTFQGEQQLLIYQGKILQGTQVSIY